MHAKPSHAAAPPSFNPVQTGQTLVEAQQSAMEMAARLSALAFKYALELNRIGFELWQKQIQHYAGLSGTLPPRQTPQQIVAIHAELIEKAARDYEDGVKSIAHAGQDMALETAQTLGEGRDHAEELVERAVSRSPKSAHPRGKGNHGRPKR